MCLPLTSSPVPYTTLFRSTFAVEAQKAVATIGILAFEPLPPIDSPRRRGRGLCSKRPKAPKSRRSEEHTSELQSLRHLVCRILLDKKKRYKVGRVELIEK